jgi:hypothetical protein
MLLLTPKFSLTGIDGKKVSFDGPGVNGAPKTIDSNKFP